MRGGIMRGRGELRGMARGRGRAGYPRGGGPMMERGDRGPHGKFFGFVAYLVANQRLYRPLCLSVCQLLCPSARCQFMILS